MGPFGKCSRDFFEKKNSAKIFGGKWRDLKGKRIRNVYYNFMKNRVFNHYLKGKRIRNVCYNFMKNRVIILDDNWR
jgi:hypothetical protein